MENKLARIVAEAKPALVVWQTGTADAIRGVDPDDFRLALDDGIDTLQAAGVDTVFMNMQYSPRTEAMLAVTAYADAMRMIALQREAVLFDRFGIMKRWNEAGIFDLYAATRKTDVAEQVHDCLGRLLAHVGSKREIDKNADKKRSVREMLAAGICPPLESSCSSRPLSPRGARADETQRRDRGPYPPTKAKLTQHPLTHMAQRIASGIPVTIRNALYPDRRGRSKRAQASIRAASRPS
jgi:hypothetical protein